MDKLVFIMMKGRGRRKCSRAYHDMKIGSLVIDSKICLHLRNVSFVVAKVRDVMEEERVFNIRE